MLGCRVRARSEGYIVKCTVRYVMGRQSAYKIRADVRRADFASSVHRCRIRYAVLICVVLDTPCDTGYMSLRSEQS